MRETCSSDATRDQPLVSIVINNYNYARYVEQAVQSALSQTYPNVEVVVVDDGSTDGSRAILATFRDRARVIEKANGGQASAFNTGIAAAQGEYILLLDSDDFLMPDAIAELVAAFPAGYSRIYYRLRLVDQAGDDFSGEGAGVHFWDFDGEFLEHGARTGNFVWPPTSGNFFSADALRAMLPIPEQEFRICADAYVIVRSALQGPCRSLDRVLGAYRIHGANNFVAGGGKSVYYDPRRLGNLIDDHFRRRELLESTCAEAGLSYRAPPTEAEYSVVKALCVGHRLGLPSVRRAGHSSASLFHLAFRHARTEVGSLPTRLRRLAILLALLTTPLPLVMYIARRGDRHAG